MSDNIEKIKLSIKKHLGTKCCVLSKQGRKKVLFDNCIIDSVYPEIFVVKHTDAKTLKSKSLAFSYTDILTKTVFLSKPKITEDEMGA